MSRKRAVEYQCSHGEMDGALSHTKEYIMTNMEMNNTPQKREQTQEIPPICGSEEELERAVLEEREPVFLEESTIDFASIQSACAIALHMHQPLIPAGGGDLKSAKVISNLQHMYENPNDGDNHNASVFHECYKRMGNFIPELVKEGKEPRVMLDYSGTLLHGMQQMGLDDVFQNLKRITCDPAFRRCVEWLATPWGHAVAPSTPVQDFTLHLKAFQHHFADLFGKEALQRVRGFSPSEMALPNHPDIAYEFVRTLKECGIEWLLVQEHTVEEPGDGSSPKRPHLPHRLVCRNSEGDEISIVALVKTQGSDTKLVAQMQPYFEAMSVSRCELAGKEIPPLVTQIADGENGGVMMNEFPPKFLEVAGQASGTETPLMNGSEYLEHLFASGITPEDLPVIQPIKQKAIWERFEPGQGPEKLAEVIETLKEEDHQFHMEGGSWTNNISWVEGYDGVLGPMERVSSLFHERVLAKGVPTSDPNYQEALYYLLISQTSCYRYWGQGVWTDYGKELCRRAEEIITEKF
jgi:hypothetical protein